MGGRIFVFLILCGVIRRLLYTLCVLWCAPSGDFIQFALTHQKKKIHVDMANMDVMVNFW